MIIKTKKVQLDKNEYIKMAMLHTLKKQWWVALIYLAICSGAIFIPSWWWFSMATVALVIYVLFWMIQFAGLTQMEQGQLLFEKLYYEITSQQILIKMNERQGMPMKWDQVQEVTKTKDAYVLWISKAQLIHLPFRVFKGEREFSFLESVILDRKFDKKGDNKWVNKVAEKKAA
ncbi:YcxB family protein [Persicobacter psychrovividus]|uniref:YcxB-like C-terminal domain-containing protein n=1 Tax=Persicobacter psychrovividus TaxID=387638 RepID=A0ABN6L9D5_9BACT|nr:hypothetical protein PEPS_01620 [Persicobacter psychrovividus]